MSLPVKVHFSFKSNI